MLRVAVCLLVVLLYFVLELGLVGVGEDVSADVVVYRIVDMMLLLRYITHTHLIAG